VTAPATPISPAALELAREIILAMRSVIVKGTLRTVTNDKSGLLGIGVAVDETPIAALIAKAVGPLVEAAQIQLDWQGGMDGSVWMSAFKKKHGEITTGEMRDRLKQSLAPWLPPTGDGK